jgi:hypothetical protein
MATDDMNFRVSTSNYLGYEHQSFQRKTYADALTNPAKYFEMREKVIVSMRDANVKAVYDTLYAALVEGKDLANNQLCPPPQYPKQKVAELTLAAAQTIQKIFEDAVELILPASYQQIAEQRTVARAKGDF